MLATTYHSNSGTEKTEMENNEQKLNRLLVVLQAAKTDGVFDPSRDDDDAQIEHKAEIRALLDVLVDVAVYKAL